VLIETISVIPYWYTRLKGQAGEKVNKGEKMKVVLREDVSGLGEAGEVKEVADGYGRNYLLPRGLADFASSSLLKKAEERRHWPRLWMG
jgi:hypothetical protein